MATSTYPHPEPLVSIKEAAQFMGMSRDQVTRLARAKRIRSYNYGTGKRDYLRFRLSELAPVDSGASPAQPGQE